MDYRFKFPFRRRRRRRRLYRHHRFIKSFFIFVVRWLHVRAVFSCFFAVFTLLVLSCLLVSSVCDIPRQAALLDCKLTFVSNENRQTLFE